ncbi:MAG: hypothetical protein ACLU0O_08895 [Collinsella sp.]
MPLEQVDRITRYVGPDGDKPRLTSSTPPTGRGLPTRRARMPKAGV